MKRFTWAFALAVFACGFVGQANAGIVNGGFETGDFTGWTQSGNTGATFVSTSTVHSGTHAAWLGPVGSDGFLEQNPVTTVGNVYKLTFWLRHNGGSFSEFFAILNGVTELTLGNPQPPFGYTQYMFMETATAGTMNVKFGFRQDPSYFQLDDVSLDDLGPAGGTATPEPASMTLLALGAVGMLGYRMRRRNKVIA